ncbi:MAG: hypothetical protein WCK01_01090 [Candidatus Uhrbacteria bacterium]
MLELEARNKSLLDIGGEIREGSRSLENAWHDRDVTIEQDEIEDAEVLACQFEYTLGLALRECLDADALGETIAAGNSVLEIIEAREDLARLLLAVRIRLPQNVLSSVRLGKLEARLVRVENWFEKQACAVEFPWRIPRLLDGVDKPTDLLALGSRYPEDWWVGMLLLPPPRLMPRL